MDMNAIYEKVMEYKSIGTPHRRIKKLVNEEFGSNISISTISRWANKNAQKIIPVFGKEEEKEISTNLIDTAQYRVIGENYAFDIKTGDDTYETIEIPMSIVDDIFRDFSAKKGGANLTSYQCIDKYKLEQYHISGTRVWGLLTNRLALNKYCNILSPQTMYEIEKNHGAEEMKRIMTDRARETVRNKYAPELDAVVNKEVQAYHEKCAKTLGSYKSLINWVNEKLDVSRLQPLKLLIAKNNSKVGEDITLLMGDVHLGRSNDALTRERIFKLADDVIRRTPKSIKIFGMGDWFETLVTKDGGMHNEQFLDMNKYSTELLEDTYNLLSGFLVKILEQGIKVDLSMLGGNHDRIGKNNDEDRARMGSYFLYMMFRETIKTENFKINYLMERVNSIVDKGIVYIIGHGDTDIYKKNPEELISMYGIPGYYHILAMGHLHQYKKKDGVTQKQEIAGRLEDCEGYNWTKLIVPALCDGNWYSEQVVVKRSAPGAIYVLPNPGTATPDILTKRL